MKSRIHAPHSPSRAAARRNWQARAHFSGLRGLFDLLLLWIERHRSRRQLMSLDSRLLHDIGITRTDAEQEYDKPFWRP